MLTNYGEGDHKWRLSRVHYICTMHRVQCTSRKQCTANHVIKQIQERWLRTLLSDTSSHYESLLDTSGTIALLSSCLKYMTLEALRSVRRENVACLHDMFPVNEVPYEMRWNKIIQTRMKTTTHGVRSFSYLVA